MSLPRKWAVLVLAGCTALAAGLPIAAAHAAPPQIRTSAQNTVPACVTPQHLMAFLKTRNARLDPRFADIAAWYKRHGEAWHVRWDYAFFQMAVETNFLTYQRGNGGWGDVNPRQNNFAGLGTTGGGVPGDSYPDVGTGVLAQIQHLVVYSGQRIDQPVGARTRLKQDDIIENVARFKGRTTFADLARRWAADRHYGASIEWIASRYRATYCAGKYARPQARAQPIRPAAPQLVRAGLGGPSGVTHVADVAPVRTIWSRSAHEPAAARTAPAAKSPAANSPIAKKAPVPAVPEPPVKAQRPPPAPAPADAEPPAAIAAPTLVAPQVVIVTTRPASAAPQASAAPTPPPLQTSEPANPAAQDAPRAFSFAAAMAATMQPSPTSAPAPPSPP